MNKRKKINLVTATPEELTDIYYDAYLNYREINDLVPYNYTATDYINDVMLEDDIIRQTAKQIFEDKGIGESVLVDSDFLNKRLIIPIRYPFEDSPVYCYVDMRNTHDSTLLKENELHYMKDRLSWQHFVEGEDRQKLMKHLESDYFAPIIAKNQQKEIAQVMYEKPVAIKKKARL
ncbi:hypothetical protein AMA91_003706 [Salmonella enterica subsp. enterica serovar Mbandaka]|uniref:hypothetical protein n=2 Tax=Enterobacterales TaxID=91347 RepID=UPI001A646EB3|nr:MULTISPECIES: hypothetical protein [Enterobacteriaceae]EDR5819410.1 hypothetical protein [Salmonella enterica subsp. enterica serovar Reading]EEE3289088.1 hypothetical protein [Salmonella enterica subsp. enterica serovar Mbandaka]ELE5114046.1 hypothetical protein [Salmonella enterica]HDT6084885.1 hypothetical protein [Citrobacter braakii]EHN5975962.1 hypothetical protein [Salmonella enterica subsp. enterica serovar Mbandaka]